MRAARPTRQPLAEPCLTLPRSNAADQPRSPRLGPQRHSNLGGPLQDLEQTVQKRLVISTATGYSPTQSSVGRYTAALSSRREGALVLVPPHVLNREQKILRPRNHIFRRPMGEAEKAVL